MAMIMIFFILFGTGLYAKDKPDLNKIPRAVVHALTARFPGAEIDKWTSEKEGGLVVHDFEFKQNGRKLEADITEDGKIQNWERQIEAKELPEAVRKAVDNKYPKAVIQEVMAVTEVKEGKDVPEGFEVLLRTSAGKRVEVTVAPDGKFLEESDEK